MFDIVAIYYCMQFQGNLMNYTWENSKKLVLDLILAQLAKIQAAIFFSWKIWLRQSLNTMASYHHVQHQKN